MKQIYLVYSCDEWKGTDSKRLILASTSQRKVKAFIRKCIENGTMTYDTGGDSTPKQACKKFAEDWKVKSRYDINTFLGFGLYDYVYDGEEL